MPRVWQLLLALALVWTAALVQRGAALAPDELEFFRATRWVGEGRAPFRDFWEHHTPLQWIVFAPVARAVANGPGVESVVAMRWAQVPLWIAIFALLFRLSRGAGVGVLPALVLLLASPTFLRRALEYRVDVLGNAAYLGALALLMMGARRWIAFGALMSAAVLANMRLAPLVVVTAVIAFCWQPDERRWRVSASALWMLAGAGAVAAAFVGWLRAVGVWTPFVEAIFRYNATSARLLEVDTFADAFLLPLWSLDIAGVAFWIAGLAGVALALREWRTAGPLQVCAVLAIVSVVIVALMEVQYDYHFQTTWLLLVPLVAATVERLRGRWQTVAAAVAAAALAVFALQIVPTFGAEAEYQDAVMTSADALTKPDEAVFDGAGYALRREPAYRYWFLTTGVRMMAAKGLLEPYDARAMLANPPAAIIADYRLRAYLASFPTLARVTTRDYVPLFRNLWVPGLSVVAGPQARRVVWIAPRAGQYDVWSSEALASHPWLTRPLEYAGITGPLAPRYAIPLRRLPAAVLQLSIDGVAQPAGVRSISVRKGVRVELVSRSTGAVGILIVPHGIETLALAPPEPFLF